MKDKKKILIFLGIVILIALVIFVVYYLSKNSDSNVNNGLDIKYSDGELFVFEDLKKGSVYEKEIVVTNTSDALKTYSLCWTLADSNLKNGIDLTYEIIGVGDRAPSLTKSQLPNVKSTIFKQVAILGNKTHTYKIKITNNASEKASFNGKIEIKTFKI